MKKKLPSADAIRRDVNPLLQWFRDRCLGRPVQTGLRFADDISDRTQPPPNLPDGPSHRLYGNYYFARDPRRLVEAPLLIAGPDGTKKLPPPENKEKYITLNMLGVTPGKQYDPPIAPEEPNRDPIDPEEPKTSKK